VLAPCVAVDAEVEDDGCVEAGECAGGGEAGRTAANDDDIIDFGSGGVHCKMRDAKSDRGMRYVEYNR
jgi:hypothetical protein